MFFKSIKWDDVYNKRITPPLVPIIKSETSTDYFDKKFTAENPELTPPPDDGIYHSTPGLCLLSSSSSLSVKVLPRIMVTFSTIFDFVYTLCHDRSRPLCRVDNDAIRHSFVLLEQMVHGDCGEYINKP